MVELTSTTGSSLLGPSGQNGTFVGLSTSILVRVGSQTVGAIQSLQVTEIRNVNQIDELGFDGHIDSCPIKATDITGSCQRIRYDRLRITEAFARGFLHADAQRIPFDITIIDKWNGDGNNAIVTTINNVWITQISYTYRSENFIIVDDMNFSAETIYSSLNGSNAATGGIRGIKFNADPVERATDVGNFRGALTAVDGAVPLVDAFYNDL